VPPDTGRAREILAGRLQLQAVGCDDLGSPLYASLLRAAADDLGIEGPVWGVLRGFEDEHEHAPTLLACASTDARAPVLGRA
jgi:hypothetical protein